MSSQLAAQWVSAVGSAGSLLGFAAYVLIMLLNRKDQREVRQEQQAQGVAAWLRDRGQDRDTGDGSDDPDRTDGSAEGSDAGRVDDLVLEVHNGGESPVFNVRCLFSLPSSSDQHSIGLALVPPATTAVRSMPFDPSGIDREELYSAPAVPEMRFTDSHGANWQRDGSGMLHRLDRRTMRRRPHARQEHSDRDDDRWEREHRARSES